MKSKILWVTVMCSVLFWSSNNAFAQSPEREISFGFRAGYANTTIYGSEVEFRKTANSTVHEKQAFEVSASMYYQVYKFFYATTGLGFIQKGGAIDKNSLVYPIDITLNYINIPVGVALRPFTNGKISVFAEGGLILNYEVSSEQDFKKGLGDQETKEPKFILSYSVGGSLRYKLTEKFSLQGDARFIGDINSFFEETLEGYYTDHHYEMKTKGKVFSVGVVYKWR